MNPAEPRPVFLMTDFGKQDPYVGLMKSVLVEEPPVPPVIDLTHEIPPQNEMNASFLLHYVWQDLPEGAIVLLVVDPEVGTDRKIIAVEADQKIVVAPDTGMVNELTRQRARYVTNDDLSRSMVTSTFHGRDWFAPVGRYLSQGGNFSGLGDEVIDYESENPVPEPSIQGDHIEGTIVHVDRFGNLISNISKEFLESFSGGNLSGQNLTMELAGESISGFVNTYGEAENLTGLVGSFSTLEIALPQGSAAETIGARIGASLSVACEPVTQDA